ncbi:Altered inheritance of mitochondria protein [Trichinella spiralis]|uniref:Altered inheritance of mitochondria protein n=1 Tax=Trichinella spiralis TaxID=6334 RepID=A0ABR3KDQ0_TRISP
MVGKGYEVSVFDVAPNVPDKQVEREMLPVECAALPFGISPMAVPDASTVIAVSALGCGCYNIVLLPTPLRYSRRKLKLFLPRLALWDCRPMDCIEIAFLGGGGHTAMVRVGHSDEL